MDCQFQMFIIFIYNGLFGSWHDFSFYVKAHPCISAYFLSSLYYTYEITKFVPMKNSIPESVILKAASEYGTPLWIYDRATIERAVKDVQVFDTVRFAQKACPNLSVVSLIRKLGCAVDAVSAGEIVRALKAGFKGGQQKGKVPEIVYTADIFDRDALELVTRRTKLPCCKDRSSSP